ncbi:putative signal peptide-containing secreted protein [Cryptosporidium canis]|uniref:Signal peptide-containing secreted protein n=1 Tax=Cryptosporidium canis TaxID=195482 RepID=A0A9D5HY35_9CRYT|nr:putative signal peptide-containing secreted protein [Cryptosporidium canis]
MNSCTRINIVNLLGLIIWVLFLSRKVISSTVTNGSAENNDKGIGSFFSRGFSAKKKNNKDNKLIIHASDTFVDEEKSIINSGFSTPSSFPSSHIPLDVANAGGKITPHISTPAYSFYYSNDGIGLEDSKEYGISSKPTIHQQKLLTQDSQTKSSSSQRSPKLSFSTPPSIPSSPQPPIPPPPPPLPGDLQTGASADQMADPLFKPTDKKDQVDFVKDLLQIRLVSDVFPAPFRKSEQKYEFNSNIPKCQSLNDYKMNCNAITRKEFNESKMKADDHLSATEIKDVSSTKNSDEHSIDMPPLPIGPPIPGTEPRVEGLSHLISTDMVPPRPQRRQDEWECIVSQVERDKTTWKVEKGRVRFSYIPKFSEIDDSLIPLSGDAKSLYQNCVSALKVLEYKSIITPPSSDEVEAEFLRTTFCISAAVYCYAETALEDPELQLYWNREVRTITDALISKDPNIDLLQVVGESLASKSDSRIGSAGFSSVSRLPEFMPQRMPNHSFSFATTKLETCPLNTQKIEKGENEYEGGLNAALSTNLNEIVVDDPEIWTMWRAIITQKERDLNMNLKRFKTFSTKFPTKFSSDSKPKKVSGLRELCVELIKEGIREVPPRYELLPMAKPNEEQVLNEFCNYAADFYFGNRQWSYIFDLSLKSQMIKGVPPLRPYSPFRYFAAETFNEMRNNCCSVIYDLFLSKVFPHLSTTQYRDKGVSMDKSKLERFCHKAAGQYFKKDISEFDSRLKSVGYFDFTSFKSRVTNYKKAGYRYMELDGMLDLEDNPGHFSIGSIDGHLNYTPRFPNLKPTRVCFSQWKAILDQNKDDINNNIETPTHLPEVVPSEWNMPQFSRATFKIACFRIIRKLYREGSVSVRSSATSLNSTEQNMEKILSDFCTESSKRYFDGLGSEYSMENLLQVQADTESQWNSVVESIMKLQENKKSTTIYWVYPVPPESYILSRFRYSVNPSSGDEEEDEKIKKSFWRSKGAEVGYESRCIESLRFYYLKRDEEIMKMEVDTSDMALIELAMREVCKEAADTFFGAIEWIWMYKLSNIDNINKHATWVPAVTGLPRRRPIGSLLKYKGAGSIVNFRNYCFAFIWTLWKSGNEPDLRISGKLYSVGDLGEQKAQLERWCTHVANEAYNPGYKLSEDKKSQDGIADLRPRMDPQTSLSVIEHEISLQHESGQESDMGTVIFSFGDASSQWRMVLSQIEVDRRRNIKRIIWLPEYAEVKEYFPGPYQGVVTREFCSDAFMNGYEHWSSDSNPISAPYGESEANRELLIEFLKYMHENRMNVRKWVLFYLEENSNLDYAVSWALNEDNWGYLNDYFQQAQIHEPDNFNQLFEEVRERVRQMGGFVDAGEDEYFSNNSLSRENLWRAIYNQMYIDLLLGRQQRVSNLPLNPPDAWLGSNSPEEFVSDCKRSISILQGQTNPDVPSSKEQTLKEILTAVRVFGTREKDESEVLDSYCNDVFLHVSDKKGHSIFKGSGFRYPGAILEFERNRQWRIISSLANKYSKLEQKDIEGQIGSVSRIDRIPGFVRHTIFRGSYDMEEFQEQCEIALQTLATDINIPSHQRIVFPDIRSGEKIESIIKEYCRRASVYTFEEKADRALNEDSVEEIAILNDLDSVSRRFKLRNPLGLDYSKRWSSIIDLAKKRIEEEKYLRMNRVLMIDSKWLKNFYPKISGQDLKNAFDSNENNHLTSFVSVSYELFSAILLGREGTHESNKDKFQFISRKTLLQFCRDVCYKYFTDEARGDVDYSSEDKAATENALIIDMIATRPRIGPDPRDPLYELYPEQGEEVPELNSFNMDQYITSRWEIYKKDFESDHLKERLRRNIIDSLNSAEINLLSPGGGAPGPLGNNIVWAPTAPFPWKRHNADASHMGQHTTINGTVLAGKTLEHMKSIFGGNIVDTAKFTIIPTIPNMNTGEVDTKLESATSNRSIQTEDKGRILPLGDFGETAKVKKIKVGTRSGRDIKNTEIDLIEGRFNNIENEYKELISKDSTSQGGSSEDDHDESIVVKGIKPRNRNNPDRVSHRHRKESGKAKMGRNTKSSVPKEGNLEGGIDERALTKEELASSRLADMEWTVISNLGKILATSEGSNMVVGIPLERPRDLYSRPMGNARGMTEACISVITNAKFRAISGTRVSGKTKEERKQSASFYCRKAAEVFYESLDGEFIPPKSFENLPGFQGLKKSIGGSKVTRGSGNRIFLGESSINPTGKEVGLKPLHKESAQKRKSFGHISGSFGLNVHMHSSSNSISNIYSKIPKTGAIQTTSGKFALNGSISTIKRSMTLDSNSNPREVLELSPGSDLLTSPVYYNEVGARTSPNNYIEMRPSRGIGSGAPRPGKLYKKDKDGGFQAMKIAPQNDINEEDKIKLQLSSRLNQLSGANKKINSRLLRKNSE